MTIRDAIRTYTKIVKAVLYKANRKLSFKDALVIRDYIIHNDRIRLHKGSSEIKRIIGQGTCHLR